MSRCAIEGNSYQPTQQRVRAPTPAGRDKTSHALVAARSLASSREDACARTPAPQRLRQDAPHREDDS